MTNLTIGLAFEPIRAPAPIIAAAIGVGAFCYGVSIVLYVTATHQAGAIRTQAIFAAAPFFGAVLSWGMLRERIENVQLLAGAMFAGAVILLAFDRHTHAHAHEPLAHAHSHRHDDGHHGHHHPELPAGVRHTHWHEHPATEHAHPHVGDLNHRHGHRVR